MAFHFKFTLTNTNKQNVHMDKLMLVIMIASMILLSYGLLYPIRFPQNMQRRLPTGTKARWNREQFHSCLFSTTEENLENHTTITNIETEQSLDTSVEEDSNEDVAAKGNVTDPLAEVQAERLQQLTKELEEQEGLLRVERSNLMKLRDKVSESGKNGFFIVKAQVNDFSVSSIFISSRYLSTNLISLLPSASLHSKSTKMNRKGRMQTKRSVSLSISVTS